MKKNSGFNNKGFSMAEILIAMALVALLAFLVIPPLKTSIDKVVYVSKLKSFYTSFNQALSEIMTEKGCNSLHCTGLFNVTNGLGDEDMSNNVMENLKNTGKFNIIRECNTGDDNCFPNTFQFLNLPTGGYYDPIYKSFVLSSGAAITLNNLEVPTHCKFIIGVKNAKEKCADLKVDINNTQPPNIIGRDIFLFHITNSGILYPQYGRQAETCYSDYECWDSGEVHPCMTNSFYNTGMSCAARIM